MLKCGITFVSSQQSYMQFRPCGTICHEQVINYIHICLKHVSHPRQLMSLMARIIFCHIWTKCTHCLHISCDDVEWIWGGWLIPWAANEESMNVFKPWAPLKIIALILVGHCFTANMLLACIQEMYACQYMSLNVYIVKNSPECMQCQTAALVMYNCCELIQFS